MVQTLQQTTEYPQLLYVSSGRCPCCAGRACHAVSTALLCTWLVFLVTLHLALCSCVFVWPKMLRIMAGTHHAVAGFTGDDAPRAVLLFFVVRPKMLGRGVQKIWFFWEITSYVSVSSSLVQQWTHIYVSLADFYDLVSGSHLLGVRLQSTGFWTFLGDDIRKRSRIQRLLVQRQFTVAFGRFSHNFYVKVDLGSRSRCLVPFSLVFLRNAWFDSGYMLCVSLRDFLADVPVVLVVQVLMGAVVEETVELRRLHSLRNLSSGAAHHRVDELMGCIFRALHTGTGPGVVSTGTRPP